jgi:SAM-dependent methyltransferase
MYVLGATGFSARGIEVDAGYSAFASRELGVTVDRSSVWDADFDAGWFGAVTLFHVLEHLPDPVRCLERCANWLRDDGTLVIEVPNMASVHQHPVKRFHFAHVFGFTSESLVMIAARAGFVVVRLEIDQHARNILAVFRKAQCAVPVSAGTAVSTLPERRSVVTYYLTLDTYTRWFRRMWQFSLEYRAVTGAESAAEVLDKVLATRGIVKPVNRVDSLSTGQR